MSRSKNVLRFFDSKRSATRVRRAFVAVVLPDGLRRNVSLSRSNGASYRGSCARSVRERTYADAQGHYDPSAGAHARYLIGACDALSIRNLNYLRENAFRTAFSRREPVYTRISKATGFTQCCRRSLSCVLGISRDACGPAIPLGPRALERRRWERPGWPSWDSVAS
ncbi:hypothetical protein PCAR4_40061 [Paraburkholderia caribensis]|nr:hypothetical protein PCAR4_40061 [Paraburkholderia caribensis]